MIVNAMKIRRQRNGFTLLEIIAAVVLISVVGILGMRHVRKAGIGGQERSCELTRKMLQNEVDHYTRINRASPSTNLRELTAPGYWNASLPTCPFSGKPMTLDSSGNVVCDTH